MIGTHHLGGRSWPNDTSCWRFASALSGDFGEAAIDLFGTLGRLDRFGRRSSVNRLVDVGRFAEADARAVAFAGVVNEGLAVSGCVDSGFVDVCFAELGIAEVDCADFGAADAGVFAAELSLARDADDSRAPEVSSLSFFDEPLASCWDAGTFPNPTYSSAGLSALDSLWRGSLRE